MSSVNNTDNSKHVSKAATAGVVIFFMIAGAVVTFVIVIIICKCRESMQGSNVFPKVIESMHEATHRVNIVYKCCKEKVLPKVFRSMHEVIHRDAPPRVTPTDTPPRDAPPKVTPTGAPSRVMPADAPPRVTPTDAPPKVTRTAAPPRVTPIFTTVDDSQLKSSTIDNFMNEIAREKPIQFFPEQLAGFTQNYSTKIGSGSFGDVYKGNLPNGVLVAVKVLKGDLNKRVKEQFMAEVGTIGRTYHIYLVRLFGFCFHAAARALVYEYMENGALDTLLFRNNMRERSVSFPMLHKIAVGIAKGIRYLHEECQHKIIHYDIKPGNILLDDKFNPKVADFGLAMLLSKEKTHVSMTAIRGTAGYAAPEMWMGLHVTEACDVYSFGMMMFEIVGRRKNSVEPSSGSSSGSQQWLPRIVWERHNSGQLTKLIAAVHGVMDREEREKAERMCKVALWCVQYQPDARPPMSKVVKMLEGEMDIAPPVNPFQHLMVPLGDLGLWSQSNTNSSSLRS